MKSRERIGLGFALSIVALSGCSGRLGRGPADNRAPDETARCAGSGLAWKTGRKTNYTSYPEPGSEECIAYSGCQYEGLFAACPGKKPESWVKARNIAAFFPDFRALRLHDLCIKAGNRTMVVTVYDTCGDSDCNGCCTRNRGRAEALIDLESHTNARFALPDGPIQWADLGPTKSAGCD